MRTYPLVCPCGWRGELQATADERDALRCPCCRADQRLETNFEALRTIADIEYGFGKGVPLVSEGCHPKEVRAYQRACPSLNVRPDGTFIVRNKSHTRQVLREIAAFRNRRRGLT